tara:strand:- start:275 stop:508 length:234 start_codon:yes stop_codon:yes gene_type:complete
MDTIKAAYLLGCKLAQIDNANALAQRMQQESTTHNFNAENSGTYGITQNGEEKKQTESPAPYGEKHQIAQTPEWIGS